MVRRATQPVRKGRPRLRSRRVSRRTIAAFSLRRRAALSAEPVAAFTAGRPSASSWRRPISGLGRSPAVARVPACETGPRAPHRSWPGFAGPCPGERRPPYLRRRPPLRPAFATPRDKRPSSGRGCMNIILVNRPCQVASRRPGSAGQKVAIVRKTAAPAAFRRPVRRPNRRHYPAQAGTARPQAGWPGQARPSRP